MKWLHYLLEANIYLAVFYVCYWLLLRRETFYNANRAYLLAGTVVCFIIPLIQITLPELSENASQQTVQIIQTSNRVIQRPISARAEHWFLTQNKALQLIYFIGMVSMGVLLLIKLYKLLKLVSTHPKQKFKKYTVVYVDKCSVPYSFLHFLFTDRDSEISPTVLRHELAHIQQGHSWDILFTEILKIVNWFNPVVYLIQHSLKALHEYTADEYTTFGAAKADKYVNYLISQAYGADQNYLANNFSDYKLLKNRIIMLYQKPSGKLARLKYLVAAPLCAGLVCASTLAFSKDYAWLKLNFTKSAHQNTLYDSAEINKRPLNKNKINVNVVKSSTPANVLPPPVPPYPHKSLVELTPTVQSTMDTKSTMASQKPADRDTLLQSFYKHTARNISYPAAARKAHICGRVTTLIQTDADGKILNVSVPKGLSEEIDNEVIQAVKSFDEKMPDANAYYSLPVTLFLEDSNGKKLPFSKQRTSLDTKGMMVKPKQVTQLSEIVLFGYNVE